MGKRYYVYALIDPRTAKPFYIGKGQRGRMHQHESDVRAGRDNNVRKTARIKEIHAAGKGVIAKKLTEHDNAEDAYAEEARLIAAHHGLTNIRASAGSWSLTREEQERRASLRRQARGAIQSRKATDNLRRWLDEVSKWPDVTFPNLADGDAKAREFVRLVTDLVSEESSAGR